ncbi:hypothetical protein GCM10009788_09540 [Nocardioides humi]|uniref:Uncharacterized protein n=1 Tax=Nocardioides humi TaxID=449461 RepID=A0ABN1ZYP7_9ACTN
MAVGAEQVSVRAGRKQPVGGLARVRVAHEEWADEGDHGEDQDDAAGDSGTERQSPAATSPTTHARG